MNRRRVRTILLASAGFALQIGVAVAEPALPVTPTSPGSPAAVERAHPRPVLVQVDSVVPGAVTTSVVELPGQLRSAEATPIHFRIEPLGGVRLFGPVEGTLATAANEDPVLLLTYSVPQSQLAGPLTLAHVVLASGSTEVWRGELSAHVMVEPRLELTVQTLEAPIGVGEVGEIEFAVTNLGNAADTVQVELDGDTGWSMESAPELWPVAPGQRVMGRMRVRAPASATPGDRLLVPFIARGRTSVARAHLIIDLALPNESPNYTLPLRVFTGATGGLQEGSSIAGSWSVSGRGEVLEGTTLSIDARSPSRTGIGSVFTREMTGPTFRATLERERWQLTAGDVFQADDPVIGAYLNGVGATGSWRSGALTASTMLLGTEIPGVSQGRLLGGDLTLGTAAGEFGVALRAEDRDAGLMMPGGGSLHGGALTYRGGSQATVRARASTGLVRVAGPDGVTLSPTAHLDLAHASRRGYLSLRARRAAEQATWFGGRGSELFAGGTLELGGGLAATGWYAADELGSRLPGSAGRTRAGSVGLRYTGGGVQAAVRGTSHVTDQPIGGVDDQQREAVAVDLSGSLGGAFATVTAEHAFGGRASVIDYLQGTLQWPTGRSWTSITGTYAAPVLTDALVRLDLVQSVDLGRTRFDLAVGGSPTRSARETMSGWARIEREIARGTSLQLGAEYQPWGLSSGSPLRFSLGISRKLSLGLPTRRPIAFSGVAFHDLDGDGVRGADEPGYSGLTLRRGRAQAITNAAGAFQLNGGGDAPLTVDAASLRGGYLVPPRYLANPGREMEIPVVQTAGISLEFFLDANGDGVRSAAEVPAAGVRITLEAQDGTAYAETTDAEGRIQIRAMPPGAYVARIAAGQGVEAIEFEVQLTSGKQHEQVIPLRVPTREIRFGPAAPAD